MKKSFLSKKDVRPMLLEGTPQWIENFETALNKVIVAFHKHRTRNPLFWNKELAPHLRRMFEIADKEIYAERRRTADEICQLIVKLQHGTKGDLMVVNYRAMENVKKHIVKRYKLSTPST